MSVLPVVLTVGIDSSRSEDVIKSIINNGDLNEPSNQDYVTDDYSWKIDNKYYIADVRFHMLNCKTASREHVANCVEAIIVYIDHAIDSFVEKLNEWSTVILDVDTDVRILVSKHFIPEKEKPAVDEWCSKNEYELVELEHDEKQNSICASEEEKEEETFGMRRVVEVLQTHQWSNLQRKKKTTSENLKHVDKGNSASTNENHTTSTNEADENTPEYKSSISAVENIDDLEELFNVFQNLQSMKSNISSLSKAEKLEQAEKVVKTFWNAIGGDMNEFSDSDTEIS